VFVTSRKELLAEELVVSEVRGSRGFSEDLVRDGACLFAQGKLRVVFETESEPVGQDHRHVSLSGCDVVSLGGLGCRVIEIFKEEIVAID